MSNLGAYQWLTTAAKRVGGPIKLLLLTAAGGAAVYKCGEIGVKKGLKAIKNRRNTRQILLTKTDVLYTVIKDGISNENLKFLAGEKFRVLEIDGDAVLIEKIGDLNNPYFVSVEFLSEISNYKTA